MSGGLPRRLVAVSPSGQEWTDIGEESRQDGFARNFSSLRVVSKATHILSSFKSYSPSVCCATEGLFYVSYASISL